MPERILISLEANADLSAVTRSLRAKGASRVEKVEGVPDVLVAMVATADGETFLERAVRVEGVRAAERDAMRFSS